MNITQEVLDYTLLAELSYVNFRDVSLSKNNINSWQDEAKKDITDKDGREIILEKLLETYEIVTFESFDAIGESDLQMMLLKDKSTGEYVISYRGTAGYHDAVITDLAQMGLKLDDNDQFKESLVVTNYWKELYGLNSSNTTLSGHSLGGALAQLNSYYYGFSAYTINAFGFDASVNGLYLSIDAYLTNQQILNNAVKNTDNIYNFIAEGGKFKDIISGGLTDIVGQFENTHIGEVIILKDSTGGYLGFIGSHSSSDINNTLEIYHNLMEAFNLENNYNILTQIIDKYIVALNGNQMKRFLDDVSKILNISLPSDLKEFAENIKGRNLTINLVENINYEEIISSNDKAKLYALINQIPFTISSSSVDLYEDFDISNMSQSELNDRGLMYEYIINNTPAEQREYSFINNETKINLIDNSLKKPAIVFGNDSGERLYGKDTDDRIYAGAGDDTIILGKGNDYLKKRVA